MAEPPALTRDELVHGVHDRRRANSSQRATQRASQAQAGQERDTPSAVTSYWCPIAQNEPPTCAPLLFRHRREQPSRFVVGQREECKLFAPIDLGDDPRRPATKLSPPA